MSIVVQLGAGFGTAYNLEPNFYLRLFYVAQIPSLLRTLVPFLYLCFNLKVTTLESFLKTQKRFFKVLKDHVLYGYENEYK